MNLLTKKCLSLLALSTVCATVTYADDRFDYEGDSYSRTDIRHNFRDHSMGDRYRQRYEKMDICAEVKEDLEIAENEFYEADRNMDTLRSDLRNRQARVSNKRNALETKRSSFHTANTEVTRLADLNRRKPNLLSRHNSTIASVNSQLPAALQTKQEAEAKEDHECRGWRNPVTNGGCRRAKRDRDAAREAVDTLNQSKAEAETQIRMLNNLDSTISAANRTLRAAQDSLANEEAATPSLVQLENELADAEARRNANNANFQNAEQRYARIAIRKEKCMEVQFDARKAKAFKNALIMFADNNGAGCDEYRQLSRRSRGYAAKEGIDEAHELVCRSSTLVRYVERDPNVLTPGVIVDDTEDDRRGDRRRGQ